MSNSFEKSHVFKASEIILDSGKLVDSYVISPLTSACGQSVHCMWPLTLPGRGTWVPPCSRFMCSGRENPMICLNSSPFSLDIISLSCKFLRQGVILCHSLPTCSHLQACTYCHASSIPSLLFGSHRPHYLSLRFMPSPPSRSSYLL